MGHSSEVGRLLDAARAQHREPRRARRHDIAVIAKDAECVRGDGSCRDVDHRRCQLTSDLEHVRQHQQQSLAGGEGRTERTASDSTVESAGGTGLALHLDHLGD